MGDADGGRQLESESQPFVGAGKRVENSAVAAHERGSSGGGN